MVENISDEELQKYIPKLNYYFIDEVHPEANKKDTVFNGLANSVVASMKLQRTLSNDEFYKFTSDLKNLFKDRKQKQRFGTFMVFMRRFLSVAFNKEKIEHCKKFERGD